MTTERWRKEDPSETTMHEMVKLCQGVIVAGADACERRPLARHAYGFPQCMLPESIRCSCLIECSSLRQREEQVSLVHNRVACPGILVIGQAKSAFSRTDVLSSQYTADRDQFHRNIYTAHFW